MSTALKVFQETKLKEVDQKLVDLNADYQMILPLYHALCRKKSTLERAIKALEDERTKLVQGQLSLVF